MCIHIYGDTQVSVYMFICMYIYAHIRTQVRLLCVSGNISRGLHACTNILYLSLPGADRDLLPPMAPLAQLSRVAILVPCGVPKDLPMNAGICYL